MKSKFTEEEKQFIKNNTVGNTSEQLAELFNNKFKKNVTAREMYQFKKSHRLKSGVKTCFIKGTKPYNHKPIGSEFVCKKDGYTYVKIAEPNTWDLKQRVIYKQHYGDIPSDYSVVFADQNKQNFELDNLILVRRKVKLMAKNKRLFFEDRELTKTGMLIAELMTKSSEKRKQNEKQYICNNNILNTNKHHIRNI